MGPPGLVDSQLRWLIPGGFLRSRDMYTLVIVDVQTMFPAAAKRKVRRAIIQEIEAAKAAQCPVIVVEFEASGVTYKNIRDALSDYPRKARVLKDKDDGSEEVHAVLPKLSLNRKVRLCGVNTDACVLATAQGLKRKRYTIEVVVPACAAEDEEEHETGLYLLAEMGAKLLEGLEEEAA